MQKLQCLSSDTFLMSLALSLVDDLLSLCSFMGSHPLQLAYLLFFSTYIFRVFCFLSPLLLTTLLFLATFPFLGDPPDHLSLGSTCRAVASALLPRQKDDSDLIGAVGFLGPILLELETCVDLVEKAYEAHRSQVEEDTDDNKNNEERSEEHAPPASSLPETKGEVPITGVIRWEEFEAIGKLYKALTHEMGEYPLKMAIENLKKKQLSASDLNLLQGGGGKEAPLKGSGGPKEAALEGWETPVSELDEFYDESPTSISRGGAQPSWVDAKASGLERFGSVKKDKEWKRTLACKLYEERWVKGDDVEDEEGMDLLWEEHEDKNKNKGKFLQHDIEKSDEKKKMLMMTKNNASRKNKEVEKEKATQHLSQQKQNEEEEEDYDDEEEDGDAVGPFCCLQALKFSTKRMRFGMGKMKNLMKVSKAIKGGVNLLRNSSSRRTRGA